LELILGTGRNASGALLTTDYYTGQLAEFLVFNDQLTIGQINLVANYLSTEYALPFAYETNVLFPQSTLAGDFNHDGIVDATDYVDWRKAGVNGQQGFADWRSNFGKSTPGFGASIPGSGLEAQVPEPATWITILMGAMLISLSGQSKIRSSHQLA
jgi:hypothetical protein